MPGWFNVKSGWKLDEQGKTIKDEPIKKGDTIIILLEKIHIGDNKEWRTASKINVSFKFLTQKQEVDKSIGTFTDVQDRQDLSIENLVILPPTKMENYLTVTVNVMELDTAEGLLSKMPNILDKARGVMGKLPLTEQFTVPLDAVGQAVNFAASLNEDDVILKKQISFFVDKTEYSDLPADRYLYTGKYDFVSDDEKDEDRTHITLRFLKSKI